jgi:hypothetical protein
MSKYSKKFGKDIKDSVGSEHKTIQMIQKGTNSIKVRPYCGIITQPVKTTLQQFKW